MFKIKNIVLSIFTILLMVSIYKVIIAIVMINKYISQVNNSTETESSSFKSNFMISGGASIFGGLCVIAFSVIFLIIVTLQQSNEHIIRNAFRQSSFLSVVLMAYFCPLLSSIVALVARQNFYNLGILGYMHVIGVISTIIELGIILLLFCFGLSNETEEEREIIQTLV
jgi:hypothetical protein